MLRLVILRLLESYFRHRWLYVLPIGAMIGLATYLLFYSEPSYLARGVLSVQTESYLSSLTNVRDNDAAWYLSAADVTRKEINELLQPDAFVRAVIQQTDLERKMDGGEAIVSVLIEETRGNAWAFKLGDNQLAVGASHVEPQIAYQLVNAVIEIYLRWQINAEQAESETASSFFGDIIETYEAELAAAREEMRQYLEVHPRPIRGERPETEQLELDRLQGAIDLASSRAAAALDKEEATRLAMAQIESDTRQKYFLIDAPSMPTEPSRSLKDIALQTAVVVGAGVLLALGAVTGGAIIDRSFRFPIDVTNRLDLPVLSIIPDTTPRYKWYQFRTKRAASVIEPLQPDPGEAEMIPAGTAVSTNGGSTEPIGQLSSL